MRSAPAWIPAQPSRSSRSLPTSAISEKPLSWWRCCSPRRRYTDHQLQLGCNAIVWHLTSDGFWPVPQGPGAAHVHPFSVAIAVQVFELFDDIMLLADGQILFHGPREEVGSIWPVPNCICYSHFAGVAAALLHSHLMHAYIFLSDFS